MVLVLRSTQTIWAAGFMVYCSAGVVWIPGLETGRNSWAAVCTADLSGLKVFLSAQDMNREVVKTDSATTRIPELDFEIPAFSQKGGRYKVRLFGLIMPHCSPAFMQRHGCQVWWLVFGHVITETFLGSI